MNPAEARPKLFDDTVQYIDFSMYAIPDNGAPFNRRKPDHQSANCECQQELDINFAHLPSAYMMKATIAACGQPALIVSSNEGMAG